jgi:hypothetical protein
VRVPSRTAAGVREEWDRGGFIMNTPRVLAAILALASFPLLAQSSQMGNPQNSPNPATEPGTPPGQTTPGAVPDQPGSPQSTPSGRQATPPDAAATPDSSAVPAAPVAELRPVNGELVSKLDTKTAKTGDDVVVQTKASVKTADGTEIPKGSKLVGHVVAVQSSASGQNSQVALILDHAQLDGGKSLPIQSQIQSIGAGGDAASSRGSGSTSEPPTSGSANANSGANSGGASGASGATSAPGYTPGYSPNSAGSAGAPAAGTVVARNGKIAIQTTNIPDVLLANNAPGQQDPRMEQASSILLGAKKDVQLDGGTPVVIALAVAPGSGTK